MRKLKLEMQVSMDGFTAMRTEVRIGWCGTGATHGHGTTNFGNTISFASSLINAGLIDEFHLFVNPSALGYGRPMFKDMNRKLNLNLVNAKSHDCGVVVLKYTAR